MNFLENKDASQPEAAKKEHHEYHGAWEFTHIEGAIEWQD